MNAPTVLRHPLADGIGDHWVHTESRSRVIHLSEGRSDLFTQANAAGLRVILVTDELSSLTQPYYQAMSDYGGRWVVRSVDGTLRDGVNGTRLERIEQVLVPHVARDIDQVAVAYLRPEPADALEVLFNVSVRHKALESTVLGGALELLSHNLRGESPHTWGSHEPANLPWDRPSLTRFARSRMPEDALIVATGTPALPMVATISARRTSQGVEEITRAHIGMGAPGGERMTHTVSSVTNALVELGATGIPLIAIALARPSRSSQLRPPVLSIPATPLALLIGPPGVKALGLDVARYLREFDAVVVGRPRIPGLLFRLGDLDGEGWEAVDALLASFDSSRLSAALGNNADLLRGLDTREDARG